MAQSDIRIREAEAFFSDEKAREPLKFGNVVLEAITSAHVRVRVETRSGRTADGWGAILLSDSWAWPSAQVDHDHRDRAMRRVIGELCRRLPDITEPRHPLGHWTELRALLPLLLDEIAAAMPLAESMPFLAGLVAASPVDAALHDAFGKANNIAVWDGYGPPFLEQDLSEWLGQEFEGRYLAEFVQRPPRAEMPVFHVVGGLDKLTEAEVDERKDDLPHSLEGWIRRDGVYCYKIKLRGRDLDWDRNRIIEVYNTALPILRELGQDEIHLSVDTNEQCESAEYLIELLQQLREAAPGAWKALAFLEQPTQRNLEASPIRMDELARHKPVILDESLDSLDSMDRALALGWSGMALKTCKTQSLSLLVAARCEAARIPYAVMDLSNPGIALLQSVGLAAHLAPLAGVEANARQYFPACSNPEARAHPDIVHVRDGLVRTGSLDGPGFGYNTSAIPRPIFAASRL